MQRPLIVANLKAYMDGDATLAWLTEFIKHKDAVEGKSIIIAAPYVFIPLVADTLRRANLPVILGAQDISAYEAGPVTGEVVAAMLKDFVGYSIIGHSERRQLLHESDMTITLKATHALAHNIMPILCVSDALQQIPDGVRIVAYEPLEAIGTGNPDSPEDANAMARALKAKGVTQVLYGGSVTPENVYRYTSQEAIDGVLVGKASTNVQTFIQIIQHA